MNTLPLSVRVDLGNPCLLPADMKVSMTLVPVSCSKALQAMIKREWSSMMVRMATRWLLLR